MKTRLDCGCWLLLLLIPLGGCMLPIPNRSVVEFAVQSRVVDAQTQAVLPHAKIIDANDPKQKTESDNAGRFQLEGVYQWHAGYLIGPISYPIWRFTSDIVIPQREIRVVAAGYEERSFLVTLFKGPDDRSRAGRLRARLQDDSLLVPTIPMKRTSLPE
jgi:hypothetical protein